MRPKRTGRQDCPQSADEELFMKHYELAQQAVLEVMHVGRYYRITWLVGKCENKKHMAECDLEHAHYQEIAITVNPKHVTSWEELVRTCVHEAYHALAAPMHLRDRALREGLPKLQRRSAEDSYVFADETVTVRVTGALFPAVYERYRQLVKEAKAKGEL